MFDSRKNISTRLADAADLLIDFATLGEYGLEPAAKTTQSCESRNRQTYTPATTRERRPGIPSSSPAPRRSRIEGPFLLRP